MSVWAKFKLSSSSISAEKFVCGGSGAGVGSQLLLCLTLTLLDPGWGIVYLLRFLKWFWSWEAHFVGEGKQKVARVK